MKRDRLEQAEQAITTAMRWEYDMEFSLTLDREASRIARERAGIEARDLIAEALAIRDGKR
jgi:hypothetical protein